MKKHRGKIGVLLLGTILVLGVIFGKPILEVFIKNKAESEMTKAYGAEVKIDKISLSPFSQELTLYGLGLTHPYKPSHNILFFPELTFQFKIQKYFSDKVFHLEKGEGKNIKIDSFRPGKKEGQVDRKKYPLLPEKSFSLKKVNLKELKEKFLSDFDKNLKKTSSYQSIQEFKKRYKGLYEQKYKPASHKLEKEIKALREYKLSRHNIEEGLSLVKEAKSSLKEVQGLSHEVKAARDRVKDISSHTKNIKDEMVESFLEDAGLGNMDMALKEKILGSFQKSQKPPKTKTQSKEPMPKFFVKKILLEGEKGKFTGSVLGLNNLKGEEPRLWEGLIKAQGRIFSQEETKIHAEGKKGHWIFSNDLPYIPLNHFTLFEGVKILKGALKISGKGSLSQNFQLKEILDLRIDSLDSTWFEKQGKWGEVLKKTFETTPLVFSLAGGGKTSGIKLRENWKLDFLSSFSNLSSPLQNEAKLTLEKVAAQELSKIQLKLEESLPLKNYAEEIEKLESQFLKKSLPSSLIKKGLKGIFQK